MGPRPCGRGNIRGTVRLLTAFNSFNGAAALRPRKYLPRALRQRPTHRASMGPRPCGRGNARQRVELNANRKLQWGRGLAAAEIRSRPRTCFPAAQLQWGRGLAAAEMSLLRTSPLATTWLQWGRGLAAAEIRRKEKEEEEEERKTASMGPRPCGRGNFQGLNGWSTRQ